MKLRHLLDASRPGNKGIRIFYTANALIMGGIVGIALIGWYILRHWFFKEFSPWSYWDINGHFWSSFWAVVIPPILYAIFLGQLDWFNNDIGEANTVVSENMLFKGFVSVFAGLFEELGHRGVLIYFGLIAVVISNFFFSWIIALFLLFLLITIIASTRSNIIFALFLLAVFIGVWILIRKYTHDNPVLLINGFILSIYQWISASGWRLYPIYALLMTIALGLTVYLIHRPDGRMMSIPEFILRVTSFTIWTGYALPKGIKIIGNLPIVPAGADKWTALIYVGAIFWSNIKFQKGHKYQGSAGTLNSYILGLYLFYIAFTYGLLYAILVHFLFDLFIFGSEHAVQIIKNRRLANYLQPF